MGQGHHDPKIIRQWVEYKLQREPQWSAWDMLIWLEENGYDVWVVVEVGHSRNESHEQLRFVAPNSPEYVISRWMTDIRLKGDHR
jgi:Zn ribbon nucleic-acid-binding protein